MKRRFLALFLAALMLLSGCADVIHTAYIEEAPAGDTPEPSLAALKNTVAAPEEGAAVSLGAFSFVSNELVAVLSDTGAAETVAAAYGLTVVGRVEAAGVVQFRTQKRCALEELITLAEKVSAEPGVTYAGVNYLIPFKAQTVTAQAAAGSEGWGEEAVHADWFRDYASDISSARVGVLSTMFDTTHTEIPYAQLINNDCYYETDKGTASASAGTAAAGILSGIYTGAKIVGSGCGAEGTVLSAPEVLSKVWELMSYGVKIADIDIGYAADFAVLVSAQDTDALRAFESETAFFTAALSRLLANGYDFLLVCPSGEGNAAQNNGLCGITDETVRAHIAVIGAAAQTENGYAVSSFTADGDRVDVYAPGEKVAACLSKNASGACSGSGAAAAYAAGACAALAAMNPAYSCSTVKEKLRACACTGVEGSDTGMMDLKRMANGHENHVESPDKLCITVEGDTAFVSNEIILITDNVFTKADAEKIAAEYGFRVVGYVELANTSQLRSDTRYTLEELYAICDKIMAAYPDTVYFAGVNYLRTRETNTLPNDPWNGSDLSTEVAAGTNWGVEAIGAAWVWDNVSDIPSIRIGLIDSMFDTDHEDVPFVRALYNSIYARTDKTDDDASHGTHVAGTIGATHNNGKGVAGVLPNAEIVGASIEGAETSALGEISLIAELADYGVKIINYSMGFVESYQKKLVSGDTAATREFNTYVRMYTQALYNLLYNGNDFLIVTSAGNSGDAGCPAEYNNEFCGITDARVQDHILVVGAAALTGGTYTLPSWSQQGSRVDVVAPGVNILSAMAENGYDSLDGTSMAAPHAAGACGVIQALYPDLTCSAIKAWIIESADIPVSGSAQNMINLRNAVENYSAETVLEPETDPFYTGDGTRPSYTYSSTDAAHFFLFLCAENENLDSGSTNYYVHNIDSIITFRDLFNRGINSNEYIAISPVNSSGTPLRTDVIRIIDYESYGSRAYKIRYQVLCSGDVVYDTVSEIREAVLAHNAWVWLLSEETLDFGTDTLTFDTDGDFIFETPVPVVGLRSYFNKNGQGSVRLVADFETTRYTEGGIRNWAYPNPVLMTQLARFMGKRGNDAYDLYEQLTQ